MSDDEDDNQSYDYEYESDNQDEVEDDDAWIGNEANGHQKDEEEVNEDKMEEELHGETEPQEPEDDGLKADDEEDIDEEEDESDKAANKIASKLVRTYTGKHGLKELVQELEKVELDKTSQSSDWGNASNLSENQLNYAANDVRYLLNVQKKLVSMLAREDRLELAQQCFSCLPVLVTLDLLQFNGIFEHH